MLRYLHDEHDVVVAPAQGSEPEVALGIDSPHSPEGYRVRLLDAAERARRAGPCGIYVTGYVGPLYTTWVDERVRPLWVLSFLCDIGPHDRLDIYRVDAREVRRVTSFPGSQGVSHEDEDYDLGFFGRGGQLLVLTDRRLVALVPDGSVRTLAHRRQLVCAAAAAILGWALLTLLAWRRGRGVGATDLAVWAGSIAVVYSLSGAP